VMPEEQKNVVKVEKALFRERDDAVAHILNRGLDASDLTETDREWHFAQPHPVEKACTACASKHEKALAREKVFTQALSCLVANLDPVVKDALQDCVSAKIPKLRDEGYPQEQAEAIAYSMRGEGKDEEDAKAGFRPGQARHPRGVPEGGE